MVNVSNPINTKPVKVELTPRQKCEGKGWIWDEATQTCNKPTANKQGTISETQPTTQRERKAKDKQNQAIRQTEARQKLEIEKKQREENLDKPLLDNIQLQQVPKEQPKQEPSTATVNRNGQGYNIGGKEVSKEQYQRVKSLISRKGSGGQVVTAEDRALAEQLNTTQQQREMAAALENLSRLNPEAYKKLEEANIDWGQALSAGAANIAPAAIGGAFIGGVTGGGVGSAISAPVGAVLGAVGGMLTGIRSNIKSQQKGEIGASKDVLTMARTNMRQLSFLASRDPQNAEKYIESYNNQLTLVYLARRQIQLETSGNLNKFMDDGRDTLSEFDLFLDDGGLASIYADRIRSSLLTGETALTQEDLTQLEQ